MALSPLSSHTVHRGNFLRVLGGSRGTASSMDGHALPGRLPELSNFYCLPGRAGGSPLAIRPRAPDSCSVEACNSSPGQESALGHFETKLGRLSLRIYWSHPPTGADVLVLVKQGRRVRLVHLFDAAPAIIIHFGTIHLEHVADLRVATACC